MTNSTVNTDAQQSTTGKVYVCECGKIFYASQSFNGHKAHCITHLEKMGTERVNRRRELDAIVSLAARNGLHAHKKARDEEKQKQLDKWLAEEHTCEKCGSRIKVKFGSGRFCSRECANSRAHSDSDKKKISASLRAYNKHSPEEIILLRKDYASNPNICPICGKEIPYEKRDRKTCTNKSCVTEYSRIQMLEKVKSGTHSGWMKRNRMSYPERFWMDILDKNGIPYKHEYRIAAEETWYSMDFLVSDAIDLEIDGGQHNRSEAIEHDRKRDLFMQSAGFTVYRIKWINPRCHRKEIEDQISDFLKFYGQVKTQ